MPGPLSLRWLPILALLGCSSPEHQLLASTKPGGSAAVSAPGGNQGTGGCSPGDCDQRHPCESDRDCEQKPGSVCVEDQCVGCEALDTTPPVCPWDWVALPIDRNQCLAWKCSPPDRCWSNLDCPPGQVCYPGVDCPEYAYPGGPLPPPPGPLPPPPDPATCHGNLCATPGCPDTARLDCMVVGCDNDFTCQSSCTSPVCTCDPTTLSWICGAGCGTSACVPPN